MDDFDVFLNHRGPDVKATFVAHLEEALRCAGFRPFLDVRALMKGDPALHSIDQALHMAHVHVAVVSPRYAESKYCLEELVAMIKSDKPVIPVFYGVEPVDLRWVEDGAFAEAFEKHKLKGRSQTKLQEWRDALAALSWVIGFRSADYIRDEAQLKRDVVHEVARLTPSNDPVEVEQHTVGLEGPKKSCIQALEDMGAETGILGLVGMGGVGKTTLAREIYNHFAAEKRFRHMTFLEIHRDPSSSNVQTVRPTWSRKLRKQLLWDLLSVQASTPNYRSWFENVSTLGPVFIVMDDVHKLCQFEELIPSTSLLHPGSRILMTSRDKSIVNCVAGRADVAHHPVFDVSTLDEGESNLLFNWHAFHAEQAPEEYKDAAMDVVKACGGLPLALKVIGSSLFDKRSDADRETIWPEAVDALRQDPGVMGVLRWSYDNLSELEKVMFLDITCVFYDRRVEEAMAYWTSCTSCGGVKIPWTSLRNLVDKNMVRQSEEGILGAHELIRDLGREIGRKDKSHILCDTTEDRIAITNQGSEKTVALNLGGSRKRKFEAECFSNMPNLHFLALPDGCSVDGDLRCISRELRWLQWRRMPLSCVPMTLNLSHILSLDFSNSTSLASLWVESNVGFEGCPKLHKLNLTGCTSIRKLPDSIGQSSQLQFLQLVECGRLKILPESIGRLSQLRVLMLCWCRRLEKLPESIGQLSRLEVLDLAFSERLETLPESIGRLEALLSLYLYGCKRLKAVPDSVGGLSSLRYLDTIHCDPVLRLPASIRLLSSLRSLLVSCHVPANAKIGESWSELSALDLTECAGLGSLLDWGALRNLQTLHLEDDSVTELAESFGLLTQLEYLKIGCERLQCLPNSIGDLKMLYSLNLFRCHNLKRLPETLGGLSSLKRLDISDCPIRRLPRSLSLLSQLEDMSLRGCINLEKLPSSIRQLKSLRSFTLSDCGSIDAMGTLADAALESLEELHLHDRCITEVPESLGLLTRLRQLTLNSVWIECLPKSITDLKRLQILRLSSCKNLKRLPKTLGALSSSVKLELEDCAIRRLPESVGELSQLQQLSLIECKNLQKLPATIRQLKSLESFRLEDCGSIEAMGALTTLQGLSIWGNTSITRLPESLGIVSTLRVCSEKYFYVGRGNGRSQVLEEDESGFLRAYRDESSGLWSLLRGPQSKVMQL